MIVLPDGKVCRNLPEQVGENTKKIQEIINYLDGVNIQDNLVVVDNISQILTAEELEVIQRPVAFIYYNDELYIKKNEDSGIVYFDNVFSITQSTQIDFQSNEIQVYLGTGALTITTASVSAYSKSQVDTLLAAKANDNEVAKLSGATFTGSVQGPELLELMSGYSFAFDTSVVGYTFENVYVGAAKTGNKLTLVVAFNATRTEDGLSGSPVVGRFVIPSEIGAKLYPALIGSYEYLYNGDLLMWSSGWAKKNQIGYLRKISNTQLNLYLEESANTNLVKNTKYYCRVEMTFLLGDNLAS